MKIPNLFNELKHRAHSLSNKFNPLLVVIIVLSCASLTTHASTLNQHLNKQVPITQVPITQVPITQPLKRDQSTHVGKLKNGLTYYIQQNLKPERKVEIRLVVKAGSIDEDEDQKGAAHFVEHLAFDGSQHFPNKNLVDTLRSVGIEYGNDLNASTFHDRTVYILPLPNNTQENLQLAFTVLNDWAQHLSFDKDEIERERSILKEETRLRKSGADHRVLNKLLPHMLGDSQYFKHEPNAAFESIDNITPGALKRYYQRWYRPDNMAIIIVGDIDVERGLKLIHQTFDDIPKPSGAIEKPKYPNTSFKRNTAFAFEDDELSEEKIVVFQAPYEYSSTTTLKDLRDGLVFDIFRQMVNKRLSSIAHRSDSPYLSSGFFNFDYIPNHGWKYFSVIPNKQGRKRALEALWKEVLRINKFSFSEDELEYQKKSIASNIQKQLGDTKSIESSTIIANIIESYLYGDTLVSSSQLLQYQADLLGSITLKDFEARARNFFSGKSKLTTALFHNGKELDTKLDSKAILKINKQARNAKNQLRPWVQEITRTRLMEHPPAAGQILKESGPDEFGISKFTLSNGIEVWHKETDFKQNQIVFRLEKQGGASSAKEDNYLSAKYAATILYPLGLADLNPVQLAAVLVGKQYTLSATTSDYEFGFNGTSTPDDLEAALQELFLRITTPRRDQALFQTSVANWEKQMTGYQASPEAQFFDSLNKIYFGSHPRTPRLLSASDLKQFSLDKMLEDYRMNVDNFNGAKATFVGNIKREHLKRLILNYLATLPSKATPSVLEDMQLEPQKGSHLEEVEVGSDSKAYVYISLYGDTAYSRIARTQFFMLNEILKIRINKTLREKLGLIYSESVDPNFFRKPKQGFWINIILPCAPENITKVVEAVNQELKLLREELVLDEEILQVKKKYQADHDMEIKSNSDWAENTLEAAQYNTPIGEFVYAPARFWSVTPNKIREAAQQFYSLENMTTVIRRPKTTPSKER